MVEPSSPYAEAVERLGDAAMTNVADAVACGRAWAEALGATAAPSSPPTNPADGLARAWASAWVGGLRTVGVTAAAVTDAAAIMACPPQLVAFHDVDLAELFPGRTLPVQLSIKDVVWASTNAVGNLPVVTVVDAQPTAVPVPDDDGVVLDTARVRVRPSVPFALDLTIEFVQVGTPAPPPVTVVVRLGTHNVVLTP